MSGGHANILNKQHNSCDCSQPPDHQLKTGGFCLSTNQEIEMLRTILLCIISVYVIFPTKAFSLDYYYGYPCKNICDCCQVMMQNFEHFGKVTSETDGDTVVRTFATEYPIPNSKTIFEEIRSTQDAYALAKAWIEGNSFLSTKELCDWGSYGLICDAGCVDNAYNPIICPYTWTKKSTSVEQATIKDSKCKCDDAYAQNARTIYRCATSYYGNPESGSCSKCISPGTTVTYNEPYTVSTTITSCYIPSGTSFSDTTGNGIYTANCYYTK